MINNRIPASLAQARINALQTSSCFSASSHEPVPPYESTCRCQKIRACLVNAHQRWLCATPVQLLVDGLLGCLIVRLSRTLYRRSSICGVVDGSSGDR